MTRSPAIGLLLLALMFTAPAADAASGGSTVKGMSAEGSCAVVGMSAEACSFLALRRARSAAIEQAAGVRVSSATVITNMRMSVDFIKTYAQGYIVNEKVQWLPGGWFQRENAAPIPEYRVRIEADVYIPGLKVKPIGLSASLNHNNFRAGEEAKVHVRVGRDARLAIFNITADDKVVMLFPNRYVTNNLIKGGSDFVFPGEGAGIALTLSTLPGHERDAEAVFVAALDPQAGAKLNALFKPFETMSLSGFFSKYSQIADYAEDTILAYEVVNKK
ncbi:MAG: DUF4384 domain-containing protein [Thermodesulfovibrionales bacterium]|nr:DUF4384 domain-containing protein [Thermodesulfovibrionales bacterium]